MTLTFITRSANWVCRIHIQVVSLNAADTLIPGGQHNLWRKLNLVSRKAPGNELGKLLEEGWGSEEWLEKAGRRL